MRDFHVLRELRVARGEHPRGQRHLSAASRPVRVGTRRYVIADDEHHLGIFGAATDAPVRLLRFIDGDLPESKKRRKVVKPDIEALIALPLLTPGTSGAGRARLGADLAFNADLTGAASY